MKIFLDTSALAKRYIREKGSELVNDLFAHSKSINVSMLCMPEIFSALNRLKRESAIDGPQYQQLKQKILDEFQGFEVGELTPDVIARSVSLLEEYALRASDALHLSSALQIKGTTFVTSDVQQLKVARSLHMKTVEV